MATKEIRVLDANREESWIKLSSEDGYINLLSNFGVDSLIDNEQCVIADFASLVDGGKYTLGQTQLQYRQQDGDLSVCFVLSRSCAGSIVVFNLLFEYGNTSLFLIEFVRGVLFSYSCIRRAAKFDCELSCCSLLYWNHSLDTEITPSAASQLEKPGFFTSDETWQQQQVKNFAESVFVLCGDANGINPVGTAFTISDTMLLTAAHNVVQKTESEERVLTGLKVASVETSPAGPTSAPSSPSSAQPVTCAGLYSGQSKVTRPNQVRSYLEVVKGGIHPETSRKK